AWAVAVLGDVAVLMDEMKRFGTMPPQLLIAPAIRYSSEGFPLDAALRFAIERQRSTMKRFPDLARVFLAKDEVPAEGELIRQPELGETLKAIAPQGAEVVYQGWIAPAIAGKVNNERGGRPREDL